MLIVRVLLESSCKLDVSDSVTDDSVTDDRFLTLLESIDQKLGGFGTKLDKVADELKALRTDFNKVKVEQTATNARVNAVSARTDDLENRVEAVEANATELKLSAADEAVLLRFACDQVAICKQCLVVPGIRSHSGMK